MSSKSNEVYKYIKPKTKKIMKNMVNADFMEKTRKKLAFDGKPVFLHVNHSPFIARVQKVCFSGCCEKSSKGNILQ